MSVVSDSEVHMADESSEARLVREIDDELDKVGGVRKADE